MNALIEFWADVVVKKRLAILVIAFLLIPLMLLTGRSIPFDNTTERYFVTGDPTLINFETLIDFFGDYEYFIVGIEVLAPDQDILTPETLRTVAAITDFFDTHRYITQVRSLTNYQFTRGDDDELYTEYLIEDADMQESDQQSQDALRSILANEKMALGTLVSPDFRHARITARVEHRDDTAAHKVALAQDFYRFLETELPPSDALAIHYSGYPLLSERFETLARDDLAVLIPIMALLMLVMLYFSFRSLMAVILPGVVIATGVLGVNEVQSYLGFPHTTVDQALLPTMIIIGIGITVHVLLTFYQFLAAGQDSQSAARLTVIHLWRPAFFTAITTSSGFLAMSVIRILPIREFAILGTIGPLLLFFFALTVLPALMSYSGPIGKQTRQVLAAGLITRFTRKLADFTLKYRNAILVAGALSLLVAVVALPRLKIDTNYVTFFREDSVTRQDIYYFDEVFKGVMTLDVILDSGAVDGIKDPEFLRQVAEFQAWLEGREAIGPVNSLVDYLKEINQALHGENPDFYALPSTREMSAQYLLLYDSSGADEDLSDIKDYSDRYLRIVAPITNMPASDTQAELETIESWLAQNVSHLNPILTGSMAMKTAQDVYAAEGMSRSFGIALLVISLFFFLLFRSLKYGALAIVPSILPILLTGAFTSILGIYLDLSTMLVGAMTMGIAVDDSIHMMNRYLSARDSGQNTKEAVRTALSESGRAVVFSSMVLVLGFSVFMLASFTTIIFVGLFGSIIMFLALLGDLVLLPALLYWVDGTEDLPEPVRVA